ncbi:MAG TPA: AAA family ATPase, partial [Thermoanaerobaculia bacterium]
MERAVKNKIEVLAVTDHNHAGSVDAFREEGERHGVAVFPGFEISSSEGIHLLCIYPRGVSATQLGRFLGELGIVDTDSSSKLSSKSFSKILELVRERGGVTIAAHATAQNGLLHRLTGQPCIEAWRDPNLLAIQIPGSVDDLPPEKNQIITNRNSEYRRTPSRGAGLALAVLNARDVKAAEDLDDPTSSSYIKMSEVTIEALRQAFLDPESRIRLGKDQPAETRHSELVAIAWEGGFLDGLAIHLNENLNVLVGGRGTGKSTIIESIRYAFGASPRADEARRVHDSIVRNVIKAGTKISILVNARKPVSADYVIERTVPNPPIVRNAAGDVLPIAPMDLFGAVEIYGQHEISEIAKSADKRTSLLSRFVAHQPDTERRKLEVKRALDKSRSEIQSISREIERINERLSLLPRIEETLKAYQSAGLEQKLAQHTLLLREDRIFASVPERLQPLDESIELLRRDLPLDTVFVNERALAGLQNRDVLARIEPIFQSLSAEVERAVSTISDSIARTR